MGIPRPRRGPHELRRSAAWSTFGPHAIRAERFTTVSSGRSFAQVAGVILGKQARGQNPDKDEVQVQGGLPAAITYIACRSSFSSPQWMACQNTLSVDRFG